jgi:hypothetical protein
MKLRYLATVVLLALTTVAAHAQVGLYINPIATDVRNSTLDTGPFAFLGPNTTSRLFWGVNLGGYYDFFHAANGLTAGIAQGLPLRRTPLRKAIQAANQTLLHGVGRRRVY